MIDPLWYILTTLLSIIVLGLLLRQLGRVIVDILRKIKRDLDIAGGKK